jgi:hypothetical protein
METYGSSVNGYELIGIDRNGVVWMSNIGGALFLSVLVRSYPFK